MNPTANPGARLWDIVERCSYPGLKLELVTEWGRLRPGPTRDYNYFLRVSCPDGTCNVTGSALPWFGRKWRLSQYMTDGEVVWTCLKAILTALEHEARERFTFDGVAVGDSHIDIHQLVALHKAGNHLAPREHQETSA